MTHEIIVSLLCEISVYDFDKVAIEHAHLVAQPKNVHLLLGSKYWLHFC